MGLASLVVGMGSGEAAKLALKRTRKYFADKKAKSAAERKAKADKAADTYQPPTQEKKKPKKPAEPGMRATESAIEKRRRRQREELHGTSK
jgi:hypothetical protein